MEKKPQKNKSSKWIALINIPVQMGTIIFLFSYAGDWLDENHPSDKVYYSQILVLIGAAIAMYNVIRQVSQINKEK
ncbi:AtpZ/AtpI family protein [Flavobacterium faecale]|uniref:AtpZ/AtpI family protein n=1 Tax=Flavobacterium faecale TaxID=1355330 RepID=UPI003AAC309F